MFLFKLNKAEAVLNQRKTKYNIGGVNRVNELQDAKKQLAVHIQEMEEVQAQLSPKADGVEKMKVNLNGNLTLAL